jgi:hypothetical protein
VNAHYYSLLLLLSFSLKTCNVPWSACLTAGKTFEELFFNVFAKFFALSSDIQVQKVEEQLRHTMEMLAQERATNKAKYDYLAADMATNTLQLQSLA